MANGPVHQVLDWLARVGVRELILCPGRRNGPFIEALAYPPNEPRSPFTVYHHFEERSAGFFALGRIKASGRPVAVITTSGTASAELLPAMIEGFHSSLALVAVTCDRPKRLRSSGAPQTIDQVGLFKKFCQAETDLSDPGEIATQLVNFSVMAQPVHINVCLDEPLIGVTPLYRAGPLVERVAQQYSWAGSGFSFQHTPRPFRPLFVVGTLTSEIERRAVVEAVQGPCICEAPSGLRGCAELKKFELTGGNTTGTSLIKSGAVNCVVRIGGVPTLRLWRDLDETFIEVPVFSFSPESWLGMGRGQLCRGPISETLPVLLSEVGFAEPDLESMRSVDFEVARSLERAIEDEPDSEPAMVRAISEYVPSSAGVYLGNSLPIREWDLAATQRTCFKNVAANRGVNGIDGQLSSFFGWSFGQDEAWGLFGDLTTLYDLAAPFILPRLRESGWAGRMRVVVINNSGGQIFARMSPHKQFLNQHQNNFCDWARMWGLDYCRIASKNEVTSALATLRQSSTAIVEVVPDNEATKRFWETYERRRC